MVGARFLDLSRFDRCTGEGRSDMAWRGAVRVGRSGDGPASRRRQRGAGVVEALEPSTGVSGAAGLAVPSIGLRQRTAVKRVRQCVGRGPARPLTRRWT